MPLQNLHCNGKRDSMTENPLMNSFELQSFQALMAAPGNQAIAAIAVKRPVVLSQSLWPEFQAWLATQAPDTQAAGNRVTQLLPLLFQETVRRWNQIPFGAGPLDESLRRVLAGEIDEPQAALMASAPEILRNLSAAHVRARLMQFVYQAMNAGWRQPMLCARVILAAIDARRAVFTRDQKAMETIAAIEYSYLAKQAVWETADGRYLRDAVGRLTPVLGLDLSPWNTPGGAEYALAALYLDSYISHRNSINYQQQIEAWLRGPREAMGAQFTAEMAKLTAMPTPLEAFNIASQHFLASANLEMGPVRGRSLKGYMEAEVWKQVVGGVAAPLAAVAAEAENLLAGDEYAEPRAEVAALLRNSGQEKAAPPQWKATAEGLLVTDSAQIVQQRGSLQATELLKSVAAAVYGEDPTLALALWRKTLPLMLERDDSSLASFLQMGLDYIRKALADPQVKTANEVPQTWPEEKKVATLLSLAWATQNSDTEREGIELVQMAEAASQSLAKEWRPLYMWFAGLLYRREASNQFSAKDYGLAMKTYAAGALHFLAAHLSNEGSDMFDHGADLVDKGLSPVVDFVREFIVVVPELERQGGQATVAKLRDLGRRFFPLSFNASGSSSAGFPLSAMLKGVLLGSAWEAGGQLAWLNSAASRQMLAKIEATRKIAPAGGIVQDVGGLGMDDLLTVFAEDSEMAGGAGPDATLHNLEVTFDRELRRRLSERRPQQMDWIPFAPAIMKLLSPETVLIDYYSGSLPSGNAGLYVHIVTRESGTLRTLDFGFPGSQVFLGTHKYPADLLAVMVSAVRIAIQKDPGAEEVTQEGRDVLKHSPYVQAGVGQVLSGLREQGKWHLCLVPCGPTHFFPFHLLPYGEGLLSDEWAVTYLPALHLLNPAARTTPARARKMASFGIDFKKNQPHGLPEILGAEDEAQSIAKIFGEPALVGEAATETALLEALTNSQRVHISTHGLLTVSAPSFQRVYLTPDQQNDGILFSYELLRHDLRGLDLLTLSACETALGRVDKGDNLRSFATNALIAGVNTVIGTLWPVRSDVTRLFFETFYGEIEGGSGKREAFQTAQLTTRQKYPQYCHWGAFWYTGLW